MRREDALNLDFDPKLICLPAKRRAERICFGWEVGWPFIMDVSRIGLLRSSSEESFEHIDADFDSTYYPELRGEALADFTPLEGGQVMMKRGENFGGCGMLI